MAESLNKPRLSLTKSQLQTAAGVELLDLCQTITGDGRLFEKEIARLPSWLDKNRSAGFPSIDHLVRIVERVMADGKVTEAERNEIYKAIESVLPPQARKVAAARRRAGEKPMASFSRVWVAGVRYENRAEIVRSHVALDDQVFLVRDRENKFSKNAVEIRTRQGYQMGFLPEDEAVRIAPLLDQGCIH